MTCISCDVGKLRNKDRHESDYALVRRESRLQLLGQVLSLTLDQIGTLVAMITGIAGTIILGLILWTDRKAAKEARLSRWQDAYQKHSEQIGHVTKEGFDRGYILASCTYESGRLVHRAPRDEIEAPMPYMDQARQHLKSGYPEIWTLYQDAKRLSLTKCDEIRQVVQSFESKVISEVEASCPELVRTDRWASPHIPRYYLDRGVLPVIFSEAFERSRGRFLGTFESKAGETEIIDNKGPKARRNLTELVFSGTGIGRGESVDMKKLQSVVDRLMSEPEIQNLCKQYQQLLYDLQQNEKANELDKETRTLWSRIQAGKPLEGSCDLCPPKPS